MIKVTVHESVESALQKAFPRPTASAARALAKYVAVVESMLFDALQHGRTPEQLKLDLYAVSMEQLANKGGQIGPKKVRMHKWLRENNLELLQTVVPGSKFTGQYTQVKLSELQVLKVMDKLNSLRRLWDFVITQVLLSFMAHQLMN